MSPVPLVVLIAVVLVGGVIAMVTRDGVAERRTAPESQAGSRAASAPAATETSAPGRACVRYGRDASVIVWPSAPAHAADRLTPIDC